jgi:hypothetical protein
MTEKKKGNEHFKKLPFRKKFTVLCYALKYYAQGDDWEFALDYAVSMMAGWKSNSK